MDISKRDEEMITGLKNIVTGYSLMAWLFLHQTIYWIRSFFKRVFGRKDERDST